MYIIYMYILVIPLIFVHHKHRPQTKMFVIPGDLEGEGIQGNVFPGNHAARRDADEVRLFLIIL